MRRPIHSSIWRIVDGFRLACVPILNHCTQTALKGNLFVHQSTIIVSNVVYVYIHIQCTCTMYIVDTQFDINGHQNYCVKSAARMSFLLPPPPFFSKTATPTASDENWKQMNGTVDDVI